MHIRATIKSQKPAQPGCRTLLKPLTALSVLHTLALFQEDTFTSVTPLHLHRKRVISISSCTICMERSCLHLLLREGLCPPPIPGEGKGNVGTIAISPLKLRWTRSSSRYCHVTV